MKPSPSILVAGGLNTDIIGLGVPRIVGSGELAMGGTLKIAAGGKSRNIAQMMANLTPEGSVGMIGRTNKDAMNLWKVPYDALVESGVNVTHVQIGDDPSKMPGVALIPVDTSGKNQIYVLPGVNAEFSAADIAAADDAFREAGAQDGILALSLELPLPTALAAVQSAVKHGMRVVLDPGGLPDLTDAAVRDAHWDLLRSGVSFIKPNEHETKMLTGIDVTDTDSAMQAAQKLFAAGISNVLITCGSRGAFLCDSAGAVHLPIPEVHVDTSVRDETGCGDQTMAMLCSELSRGSNAMRAASMGIIAGTLQFYRAGVNPVSTEDMQPYST